MKKPIKTNVKFRDYSPGQTLLLPPSLDEMIEANHPVRIVNRVIDQIEIDPLIDKFKGGGTSSYHPRMLLKVVVFVYLSNIYSSRRMEAALKENIFFMWISGMSQPLHFRMGESDCKKQRKNQKAIGRTLGLYTATCTRRTSGHNTYIIPGD
jgi:transposase